MDNVISLDSYRESRGIELTRAPEYEPKQVETTQAKPKRAQCSGLQYYPRLGIWKAENVQIDPTTLRSTSYGWWIVSQRFGKTLVFNEYRYSVTTAKHQSKLRGWLRAQGYDYITIEAPGGLQDLESATRHYERRITSLESDIARKGTRKAKNEERRRYIQELKAKIAVVEQLERSST